MSKYFLFFIGGFAYSYFLDFSIELTRKKWRKEANYKCNNCKVWDCPVHYCRKKGEKNEKN